MDWQPIASGVDQRVFNGTGGFNGAYHVIRITNSSHDQHSRIAPTIIPYIMPRPKLGATKGRVMATLKAMCTGSKIVYAPRTINDPDHWKLCAGINGTFYDDKVTGEVYGPVGSYDAVLENGNNLGAADLIASQRSFWGWKGIVRDDGAKPYVIGDADAVGDNTHPRTGQQLLAAGYKQFMGGAARLIRNGSIAAPGTTLPNWSSQKFTDPIVGRNNRTAICMSATTTESPYPKWRSCQQVCKCDSQAAVLSWFLA